MVVDLENFKETHTSPTPQINAFTWSHMQTMICSSTSRRRDLPWVTTCLCNSTFFFVLSTRLWDFDKIGSFPRASWLGSSTPWRSICDRDIPWNRATHTTRRCGSRRKWCHREATEKIPRGSDKQSCILKKWILELKVRCFLVFFDVFWRIWLESPKKRGGWFWAVTICASPKLFKCSLTSVGTPQDLLDFLVHNEFFADDVNEPRLGHHGQEQARKASK